MNVREAWITDLLAFIDSGADDDALLETTIGIDSPELYRTGVETFGSWDAALAAALVWLRALEAAPSAGEESSVLLDVPRPERRVRPEAHTSLFVVAHSGAMLEYDLDRVAVRHDRALDSLPDAPISGAQRAAWLVAGGDDTSMVLVTTRGQGVAADSRLLGRWDVDTLVREPSHRFSGLDSDEVFATGVLRRQVRLADRFYSVSVFGQIKASDAKEYERLSADATPALLLKDGDALLEVFAGAADTHVFVASSAGKGIHFPTADIRSQGRRATGVRAIGLDAGARVVGAFDTAGCEWIVLATDAGIMKRMPMSEFRPQKRGGGGLQTYRVSDDPVAAVAGAPIDGDVIVLTDRGRVTRFPTYDLPLANRAGRGEPMLQLEEGEAVVQLMGVPAGSSD